MKTRPAHSRQDLEDLLAGTRPADPSPELMARLRAAVPGPARPGRRYIRFLAWSSPLTSAAALVFGLQIAQTRPAGETNPDPAASPAPARESVDVSVLTEQDSRRYLLNTEDLGIVRDSLNRPVRLVRAVWFDENRWSRPGGPPELQETALHQEIVPVLLPTQ